MDYKGKNKEGCYLCVYTSKENLIIKTFPLDKHVYYYSLLAKKKLKSCNI